MEQALHEQPARPPRDPLSVLRSVESTPPGDIEWARHCTRQQAAILLLSHGSPEIRSIGELATASEVAITATDDLPLRALHVPGPDGWHIYLSTALTPSEQLRTALRQIKHVIDHPVRARSGSDGFSDAEYDALADYFADLVLGEGTEPRTFRHQLSGKENTP